MRKLCLVSFLIAAFWLRIESASAETVVFKCDAVDQESKKHFSATITIDKSKERLKEVFDGKDMGWLEGELKGNKFFGSDDMGTDFEFDLSAGKGVEESQGGTTSFTCTR